MAYPGVPSIPTLAQPSGCPTISLNLQAAFDYYTAPGSASHNQATFIYEVNNYSPSVTLYVSITGLAFWGLSDIIDYPVLAGHSLVGPLSFGPPHAMNFAWHL
jgi:hypothetical protein